jgi:hypothetical protein
MFKNVPMSDKRYDQIYERIQESYPNACVLYIDEVINEPLLCAYKTQKEQLKAEEKQLFHGTSDNLINIISEMGFDPTKNKAAVYGYGVYFAKNARYSFTYMKSEGEVSYMFLADVLVGRLTTGKRRSETYNWDNNVDNITNPSIYTTPYPDGAYPRYIIAFHKNAK